MFVLRTIYNRKLLHYHFKCTLQFFTLVLREIHVLKMFESIFPFHIHSDDVVTVFLETFYSRIYKRHIKRPNVRICSNTVDN